MQKIKIFLVLIFIDTLVIFAQVDSALDYWPAHKGDVWQYHSISTGEIAYTNYIDSISVNSFSKDTFIYYKSGNQYRIDSLGNLYNLNFMSSYVRYKLYADSGDTWIAGYENDTIPVTVTVWNIYSDIIFGINTTVKVFKFEIQYPPPQNPFSLGEDYLAKEFGLVRSDIEGGNIYYLSGAIINGVKYGIITSIDEIPETVPKNLTLYQNYPNPFNPSTTISFKVSQLSNISLVIYDVLGKEIYRLIDNREFKAGEYRIVWNGLRKDGSKAASGIYFYRLTTGKQSLSRSMILLK
jgi:hypothetical protein